MKHPIVLALTILFSVFLIIPLLNTVFAAESKDSAVPFWIVIAFVIAFFAFLIFVIALLKLSQMITLILSKNSESLLNLSMPTHSDSLSLSSREEKMMNKAYPTNRIIDTVSDVDAMFNTSKRRLMVLMITGPAIIAIFGILAVTIPADVAIAIVFLGLLSFMIIVMIVTTFYHFSKNDRRRNRKKSLRN
jgi:ABC-type multidrug transport system fused ATPase/permease subunit